MSADYQQPVTVEYDQLAYRTNALGDFIARAVDLDLLVAAMWDEVTVEGADRLANGPLATVLSESLERMAP
jgi:hypothetical protein